MKYTKKTTINNPYIASLHYIDLHGYDRNEAVYYVDKFIKEEMIIKSKALYVIHGIGSHILKKTIHEYLNKNKNVLSYMTDYFNDGITIIYLKNEKE